MLIIFGQNFQKFLIKLIKEKNLNDDIKERMYKEKLDNENVPNKISNSAFNRRILIKSNYLFYDLNLN